MNTSDNLITGEVSSMCSININALNGESAAVEGMSACLDAFMTDPDISGAGFAEAGIVAEDLQKAFMMMRAVNDLDIMDFDKLMSGIGGEDLIGEVIIGKMEESKAKEEEYNSLSAAYAAMAASAPPWLAGFYSAMAAMYAQMAQIEHTIYEYWEAKSDNYDTIEATTAGLFTQTAALRADLNKAIEGLRNAFVLGEGVTPEEAGWRKVLDENLKEVQRLLERNESANEALSALKGSLDIFISSVDPVNLSTGNFYYDKEDIRINAVYPIYIRRYYNARDNLSGAFGHGWIHNYEKRIREKDKKLVLIKEDGKEIKFRKSRDGKYRDIDTGLEEIDIVPVDNEETDVNAGTNGTSSPAAAYIHRDGRGIISSYDKEGYLIREEDGNGNKISFKYTDADRTGYRIDKEKGAGNKAEGKDRGRRLREVTDGYASLYFEYDEKGYLVRVSDHTGRSISYGYGKDRINAAGGDDADIRILTSVANTEGNTVNYHYGLNGKLRSITNARGIQTVINEYDAYARVIRQSFPDGGEMSYGYNDKDRLVTLTERNGSRITYEHDELYRNIRTIYHDSEEIYEYNGRNRKVRYTDRNGNTYRYSYDPKGNLTQSISPDGTKTNMTYDAKGHLISVKVNGITRQKNSYDTKGNLTETEDALGRKTKVSYNGMGLAEKITAPDGSITELTYDDKGNITVIKDPVGTETGYVYDALNRVMETTDGNGNKTKYEYNSLDKIVSVINPEGHERIYTYNASGRVESVTDFDGGVIRTEYNSLSKPMAITDKMGRMIIQHYDKMWNLSEQILPTGAVKRYVYDEDNRLIREEVHISKKEEEGSEDDIAFLVVSITTYAYDKKGNLIKRAVVDPATENILSSMEYTYDAMDRIIREMDAEGSAVSYGYDADGSLSCVTDPNGNEMSFVYNDAGERISETDTLGNTTRYTYSELGKIESITDPKGNTKRFIYEAGGRLKEEIYADGKKVSYEYDGNGNVIKKTFISAGGEESFLEYTYDCMDRVIRVTGNKGQEMTYTYDAAGNVISRTDARGNTTKYEYSLTGSLTAVEDAVGNRAEYEYDALDNLIHICQKDREGITTDSRELSDRITDYIRNPLGQIETVRDALGFEEHYTYDALGRIVNKTDKEGYVTSFSYTPGGQTKRIGYDDGTSVEYSYDALKKLKEVKDWLGITTIKRDSLGRAVSVTDHNGDTVSYEWGSLSEKKALIYPDGRRAEYEYDDLMRLVRLDVTETDRSTEQPTGNGVISGRTEGATLASILYTYDTEGRLKEKKYRDGLRTVWHYNDDGLPEELIHEDKEGILDKYTYSYDAMGNKTGIIKVRRGLNEESGSYSYGYDELNRLTGVSKDGELIREYSFDAFSNRSVLTDHGRGTRTIYHYNALNQLTDEHTEAIASADKEIEAAVGFNRIPGIKRDVPNNAGYTIDKVYKYDKRGNLIREMRGEALIHGYEYGAINRLTRSWNDHDEEAGYIYNGLGHRVGRETAKSDLKGTSNIIKQTYLIDMLRPYHNLLNLTDRSGNRTQDFIYDGNVAGSIGGACDPVHFYMQDELGSPIRVSANESGIDNATNSRKAINTAIS